MANQRNPPIDVAFVDSQGRVVTVWYDRLKFLDQLQPLSDIPAPVLPAPITPGSTTATVSTPALTNTGSPPGTPSNTINFGAAPSVVQQQNNWATVVVYFTSNRADLLAAQTAISALNTRVTALENKVNAIIAAL